MNATQFVETVQGLKVKYENTEEGEASKILTLRMDDS